MRFKGKVAIVAGGGQGLGEAVAVALGAEGANVSVWDINEEGAKETVKKIQAKKGKANAVKMDALDYDQVNAGVKQVVKDCGKLDIMVCTVGGGKMMPFEHCSAEFFKQQLDFQIVPVFNCAHTALAPMKQKNYGKMLFFISSTGGQPMLSGYQAGKAAVQSVILSMVAELEMAKVTLNVNGIMPGMTDTPLTRGAFKVIPGGDKMLEDRIAALPRGINQPENVAKLALFLLSDDADHIHGQIVSML